MLDAPSFIQILGNFGFPIAIATYLLLRFEKRLESLKTSIDNLAQTFSKIEK